MKITFFLLSACFILFFNVCVSAHVPYFEHRDYSEDTARKIDEEISRLVQKAYNIAKNVLEENLDILHALADLLLEKETVLGKELDALILTMKPGFEFSSKIIKDEEAVEEPQTEVETNQVETKE